MKFKFWCPRTMTYCTAGNFRQRKISSKATVGQFVRNLFSSNVGCHSFALWSFGCRSFAYRLSSHSWPFLIPPLLVLWKVRQEWRLFIFISRESKWGTLKSAGNPRCAVPAESHSICTDRRRPGPAAALQVSPTSDTCQSVAILMNRPHLI